MKISDSEYYFWVQVLYIYIYECYLCLLLKYLRLFNQQVTQWIYQLAWVWFCLPGCAVVCGKAQFTAVLPSMSQSLQRTGHCVLRCMLPSFFHQLPTRCFNKKRATWFSTVTHMFLDRFLECGCIVCNAERCFSHGNSVRLSARDTLVLYPYEWR